MAIKHAVDPQTGEPYGMPFEYTLMVLCRDVFHCTPSQVLAEDWDMVQDIITVLNAEEEYKIQARANNG